MKRKFTIILLTTLLFTACKPPQHENRGISNNIQKIVLSTDSSMVNPMNPVTNSSLTLNSDLTLSSGVKITQAQFNNVIKDIKFIDISKLKEIKHPPSLGDSYKSVSIQTDKKTYHFSSNNYKDYPSVIAQLSAKIYKLQNSNTQTKTNDSNWHKLKMLKEYDATDFNLKEGVEYLEIRIYTKGQQKQNYSKKYQVAVRMYRTPLDSFGSKMVKEFKNIEPNFSNETNIKKRGFCLMAGCTHILGNGMMIDSKKKMWSMNTTDDIIDMIGEVDTPAEAKLIVWLKDKNMRELEGDIYKYRKVSNGYEISNEYENGIANFGECGHFIYEMFVSKDGEISNKRLVEKKELESGCLEMD